MCIKSSSHKTKILSNACTMTCIHPVQHNTYTHTHTRCSLFDTCGKPMLFLFVSSRFKYVYKPHPNNSQAVQKTWCCAEAEKVEHLSQQVLLFHRSLLCEDERQTLVLVMETFQLQTAISPCKMERYLTQ